MSLTGYLSEYSLAEIFNFVQEGNKTGLLSIEPDCGVNRPICDAYDITFQGGRIMSVANRIERQGLLKMMEQRRWLSPSQVASLATQTSFLKQPLGIYLKSHNAIDADRLTLIFNAQVISNICKMFVEVHHGRFKFDPKAPLAYAEMTGLSLTAKQATLMGLRLLRDWSDLADKLPAPESALQRVEGNLEVLKLDPQEAQVLKLAIGEMSIAKIAIQLGLDLDKVRQIGFRLMTVGLIKEMLVQSSPAISSGSLHFDRFIAAESTSTPKLTSKAPAAVSKSFLGSLMGFLTQRA
jgi:hypothetical protein